MSAAIVERVQRAEGLRVFSVTVHRGGQADATYFVLASNDQEAREGVVELERQIFNESVEPTDYCNVLHVCSLDLIVKGAP